MTAIICKTIDRTYANNGQHSQQMLDFTLTGQIRKADHLKWDKGSDIPEYAMSVKSARFTLATDLIGETLEDKVNNYFARVLSTSWAYVTKDGTAYIMNAIEFKAFLLAFGTISRMSSRNGGQMAVKGGHESKKMVEWLMANCGD